MDKNKKIAVIAGGGSIPKRFVEHLKKQGREFFVVAIKENAEPDLVDETTPHIWIRIGQAGTGFARLKKENVEEVVLIGTIRRPSFFDLVPDWKTTKFFAKIASKSLGDDGILRALVKEIEKEGIAVKGVHEVMSEILAPKGVLGKIKPDKQAVLDIKRGMDVVLELGRLDIGQAVIVQQGLVLGVEGIEGTDELIKRCGAYKRKGAGGVLVKARKPQQDKRIDLPTIGLRTIKGAKEAGLRGVVIHAHNSLIVDEAEVIKLADKEGMFIMGVDPADYVEDKE